MALVFFGPRKLPQLSRSMGKHLAEFRRASEDFKRTWDREVTLEEVGTQNSESPKPHQESNLWDDSSQTLLPPTVEAVAADRVIPRQPVDLAALPSSNETDLSSVTGMNEVIDPAEPSRKRDWL
ncbi:MAG: twin-arginine translocase TatA/TatE family subunit [Pyrinomonadaceae bacterium]|nr:twin-arginine translocase TatA/TatE family subunit [Pyrinomonadaceae bacterium]